MTANKRGISSWHDKNLLELDGEWLYNYVSNIKAVNCTLLFVILRIEPRALFMLGKCSTT
jgi:hypothetical protein